jgi:hypothetical protein
VGDRIDQSRFIHGAQCEGGTIERETSFYHVRSRSGNQSIGNGNAQTRGGESARWTTERICSHRDGSDTIERSGRINNIVCRACADFFFCLLLSSAFLDTMRTLSHFAFPGQLPPNLKGPPAAAVAPPAANAANAAAALSGKKRVREEEQAAAVNKQEFGKAWS